MEILILLVFILNYTLSLHTLPIGKKCKNKKIKKVKSKK